MDADKGEVRLSSWLILRYRSDIRLEELKETTLTLCVFGRWCRVCRRGLCCPRPGRSLMRRQGGFPAAESPPQQWRAVATRTTITTSRRQSSVACTSCSVSYTAFLVSIPLALSRFVHVHRGRFRSMLFLQLSNFMDSVLGYAVYAAHFLLLEGPPASEVFNFLCGWGSVLPGHDTVSLGIRFPTFRRNAWNRLRSDGASYPSRTEFSNTPLWKPQTWHHVWLSNLLINLISFSKTLVLAVSSGAI